MFLSLLLSTYLLVHHQFHLQQTSKNDKSVKHSCMNLICRDTWLVDGCGEGDGWLADGCSDRCSEGDGKGQKFNMKKLLIFCLLKGEVTPSNSKKVDPLILFVRKLRLRSKAHDSFIFQPYVIYLYHAATSKDSWASMGCCLT